MTDYNISLGGKRTFNPDGAVYPSVPDPALQNFAMHKAWGIHRMNRVIDFGTDEALKAYLTAPLVGGIIDVGDRIGIIQVPASPCVLLGACAVIITPETGFSFTLRDNTAVIAGMPAINGATVNTVMTPAPQGIKNYSAVDMLWLTVTTAGVALPKVLAFSVSVAFMDYDERRW